MPVATPEHTMLVSDLTTNEPVARTENEHDEREATELGQIDGSKHPTRLVPKTADLAGGTSAKTSQNSRFDHLKRIWKDYIQLHVPHAACRDHLGRSTCSVLIEFEKSSPTFVMYLWPLGEFDVERRLLFLSLIR